jgi:hypothetical protein
MNEVQRLFAGFGTELLRASVTVFYSVVSLQRCTDSSFQGSIRMGVPSATSRQICYNMAISERKLMT